MVVSFKKDEALICKFYLSLYKQLPLYQKRRDRLMKSMTLLAMLFAVIALVTHYIWFNIGFVLAVFFMFRNSFSKISPKTIHKVVAKNQEYYGAQAFAVSISFNEQDITLEKEVDQPDQCISYQGVRDVVYDEDLFCFTDGEKNMHYFPISAIPESVDALAARMKAKNPKLKVIPISNQEKS